MCRNIPRPFLWLILFYKTPQPILDTPIFCAVFIPFICCAANVMLQNNISFQALRQKRSFFLPFKCFIFLSLHYKPSGANLYIFMPNHHKSIVIYLFCYFIFIVITLIYGICKIFCLYFSFLYYICHTFVFAMLFPFFILLLFSISMKILLLSYKISF